MFTDIKTFEEACTKLNIPSTLPDVSMLREQNQKAVVANYKLDVIQEAINEDWKADWSNWNQRKYYPWFEQSSSGVGFSFGDFAHGIACSYVGSRRVFPSAEIAR